MTNFSPGASTPGAPVALASGACASSSTATGLFVSEQNCREAAMRATDRLFSDQNASRGACEHAPTWRCSAWALCAAGRRQIEARRRRGRAQLRIELDDPCFQ